MEFKDKLNYYIDLLNCSSKDFAKACHLSTAAISRYRNGERIPNFQSKQFNNIVCGIVSLAKEQNINDITTQKIIDDFFEAYGKSATDFEVLRTNFNKLITRT